MAVFTLSETPDSIWIRFFRERSRYSIFDVTRATFSRNRIHVEVPREDDLEEMIRSMERFIEGTNLDVEFRAPQ